MSNIYISNVHFIPVSTSTNLNQSPRHFKIEGYSSSYSQKSKPSLCKNSSSSTLCFSPLLLKVTKADSFYTGHMGFCLYSNPAELHPLVLFRGCSFVNIFACDTQDVCFFVVVQNWINTFTLSQTLSRNLWHPYHPANLCSQQWMFSWIHAYYAKYTFLNCKILSMPTEPDWLPIQIELHSYLVPCFVRIYLTSELYILLLAEK